MILSKSLFWGKLFFCASVNGYRIVMKRNIVLDLLRLVLAFMVVGIHTHFLADVSAIGSALTAHGLFTIAVPIFLLISGFYIFPVLEKGEENKWLKRLLVLYFVWMAFYAYVWIDTPDFSRESLFKLLHRLLFGYAHLWYIAGLIGATVVLKLMHRYVSSVGIVYSIVITFLTGIFIEHANYFNLFDNHNIQGVLAYDWIYRNFLFISYPFLATGYIIHKYALQERISLVGLLIFSLIGVSLIFLESYYNFQTGQTSCDNLLSMLIAAPLIFMLFLRLEVKGYTKKIALYAASIYFVHIAFIHMVEGYRINTVVLTIGVYVVSLAASYFIVRVYKRVPYIL